MLSEKNKHLVGELGFDNLPEPDQLKRLKQYYDTLRIRVGLRLEQELEDKQLEEVVKIMEQSGPDETEKWLVLNVSNYSDITKDEEDKLKQGIKKDTALIKSIIEKF